MSIADKVRAVLTEMADELDKQGYVFEGSRVRGLRDGLTCNDRHEPSDHLLAAEYLLGSRIGGEFFFRYSLPTMLRLPALTT